MHIWIGEASGGRRKTNATLKKMLYADYESSVCLIRPSTEPQTYKRSYH